MAGITLAQATAKLTLYMGLDDQLGVNAEMTIDGTTVKRRDVQKQIEYWNSWVVRLSRSGVRVSEITPK